MRWDELFADLEAQASALDRAQRAGEVEERTRGEIGALSLLDRARAAVGQSLRLHLTGGVVATGILRRVGSDWLLLDVGSGHELLVSAAALTRVRGLVRYSAVPDSVGVVESRLGLRHVLRGIARDRSATRLHLVDGSVLDATIDRIGADFVEVAAHAAAEARRRTDVRAVEALPLTAIAAVRRGM